MMWTSLTLTILIPLLICIFIWVYTDDFDLSVRGFCGAMLLGIPTWVIVWLPEILSLFGE